MSSKLDIFNEALILLGEKTLTSPDQSGILTSIYDTTRLALLRDHDWKFSLVRATLASLVLAPIYDFTYQYQLPSDCLRILSVYDPASEYIKEGNKILTNDDIFRIIYVSNVTDTAAFDPMFAECLALKLAIKACVSISDSVNMKVELTDAFRRALKAAKTTDSQEGYPMSYMDEETGSWVQSHY